MKKTVLITGASSGIGAALCVHYAKSGYNIGLMARRLEQTQYVANQCIALGVQCSITIGDVSKEQDCQKFVQDAINQFGSIHILINNAGISMRGIFNNTQVEVLKQLMDINFWGTVYCTKAALPYLLQTQGSVVGVSSIAGFKGLPARTGYSASKFAMQGFLESLRCENLETGLHVLIACPGYTDSNIRRTALNANGTAQGDSPLDEKNLMSSSQVAEYIFNAVKKKRKYLILTLQGKLAVIINKISPSLADRLTYNVVKKEPGSPF